MSPVSSIYDHLTFNIPQQPPSMMNQRHRSNYENLHLFAKRKSLPIDEHPAQIKRRYTITNIPIRHRPNLSIHQPKDDRILSAVSTMDFRPLITNGRRKLGTIPTSSSMIIIKKKSPPPMKYISVNQKPLIRSIPVDLRNNKTGLAVSPLIPSSLSYSSSSPSTSASSTNVGTIFLPIQVTKSLQNINNNNNNNNPIKSRSKTIILNEGQPSYRHVNPSNSFVDLYSENRIPLLDDDDDDLDRSTRIPFASSIGGEGYSYKSSIMMDSNVLRLIRRYDPEGSSTIGIIPRRSLERSRGLWHSTSPKADTPQPFDSSPFFLRRSLTTTYEDEVPLKQSPTARLQRQQAIHESESPPTIPPPPPPVLRPILKYNTSSRSRSEFIVQPHQTEPLTIEIDPMIPPSLPNESPATYQPLITTGTKRVCSALSKSEWDLRIQQDQAPIRPPSPSPRVINQQQEKESYRPTLGRSKSSITINNINDQDSRIDDVDEISAPILPSGSCVEKLKRLFVTKSSLDLTNPSLNKQQQKNDANLNRPINSTKSPPFEIQPRMITKPTTIIQDVTPIFKKPVFRNQKTIDSPETIQRTNNSSQMPASELSHDTYRFRRLNDQNSLPARSKNIAKVEPYSMNTNTIPPLYQPSQPIIQPTIVPSLKARIHLNSMGNTSASSSAGSLRHSDFLQPIPAYSKAYPQPPSSSSSSYPTPPILLSESLSHGSLHQLPVANVPSSNGHTNGLPSLKHNSQDKYPFQSSMQISSPPSLTQHSIPTSAYHYRPLQNIERQPIRPAVMEEQQQDNHQSRRRFQRRKQMKRSKSADLYQDLSSFASPNLNEQDFNRSYQPQRSISREYLAGGENLSSSSSSSSLTADMERVNRAALLRYKSLDSIAMNSRKSNLTSHRRTLTKPAAFDFDSDDSVCGIPKPRKTIGR